MTATLPSVVAADDLIVRSAPRNQRASPSPGWSATTGGDASCASGDDMGASLPTPAPFVQLRRGTGVAACVTSLRRSGAEREPRLFGRIVRRAAAGGSVGDAAATAPPTQLPDRGSRRRTRGRDSAAAARRTGVPLRPAWR